MKYLSLIFTTLLLFGCTSIQEGSIDQATVLHWENDRVTLDQFTRDHKECLGVTKPSYTPRTRLEKFLMPNAATTMPKWDGLWVTFQSNEYSEGGQRIVMSVPSNQTANSVGAYRKCMFGRNYLLRSE